jgi:hypothetical protein
LIGRSQELGQLEHFADDAQMGVAQLVVMFGRRRVGKTFLLRHFTDRIRRRPHSCCVVYFAATREGAPAQRAQLAAELEGQGALGATQHASSWIDLLGFVFDLARSAPTILVIDEAPYLVASDAAWPTIIQKMWDAEKSRSDQSRLLLILNGSAISTMTSMVSSRGALFGRPDAVMRIDPFTLPMSHQLLGNPGAPSTIEAHAACGGYPLLLQRWNVDDTVESNLIRLAGEPFGPLATNANSLLLDVADSGGHHTVLGAIGRGASKLSEISARAGKRAEHSLDVLMHSGFVARRVPAGEPARKNVHYALNDSYLRLWYSIVDRNMQHIESGQGAAAIRGSLPLWDRVIADVFEHEARFHAARLVQRGELDDVVVGEWWTDSGDQAQVDVVGLSAGRWLLAGEAKWSDRFGRGDLGQLERSLHRAGRASEHPSLATWSRFGPTDDLISLRPDVLHFTAADMVSMA